MRRFYIIILFFVFIGYSGSPLLAQKDSTSVPVDSVYSLSVNSLPDNYDVYIDSIFIGKTPVANQKLKASVYTLKVLNLRALNEWESENKIISLDLISDTTITVNFRNEYFINTVPVNASVIKNDSLFGFTPLRLFSIEKLSGSFILRKEGYFDKKISIDNYDFGKGIVETLTPNGGRVKNEVWKNKNTNFNTKRNFPVIALLGGALVGGTFATFNYKTKANDAYSRYLTTFNRADYDESTSNDTYSAIFLVATQLTLGVLIYFLFAD